MKRIVELSTEKFDELGIDGMEGTYFQNGCWFREEDDDLIAWQDAGGKKWLVVDDCMGFKC